MKEEFETAKLIIVKFDLADIITTSNGDAKISIILLSIIAIYQYILNIIKDFFYKRRKENDIKEVKEQSNILGSIYLF